MSADADGSVALSYRQAVLSAIMTKEYGTSVRSPTAGAAQSSPNLNGVSSGNLRDRLSNEGPRLLISQLLSPTARLHRRSSAAGAGLEPVTHAEDVIVGV